ncbi:MAG: hypothetical protein PHP85_08515 [Gallionella sp.]|nr:hypothetical protein [Gallionella sp.]
MKSYQIGDIVCTAVPMPDGKWRAEVRVNGLKLQPPSKADYIFQSEALFQDKSAALHCAIDHANEKFPAE